jgi:hypothetical protein
MTRAAEETPTVVAVAACDSFAEIREQCAWIGGLVDTRNLGPLLEIGDSGDDEVVCEYLSVFGVDCIDCGDGDELCLYVEAHFGDADLVPGLTLDPDPLGR